MEEVRSKCITVGASITRPSDTTPYTIGDVINESTSAGAVITFPLSGPGASVGKLGSGVIQSATLISSVAASTKLEGRLWLFDTTLTADNDNAEFTPTDAEMRTLVAVIQFPSTAWINAGATSPNAVCQAQNLWLPINTLKDDNALYGVLEARNAYTPASGEVLTIRLGVLL